MLLPGIGSPFNVGRPASLSALDAAAEHEGFVIVALQKDGRDDVGPDDLLDIGVLARAGQTVWAREGRRAQVLEGVARVRLEAFAQSEPHLVARWSEVEESWPEDVEVVALQRSLQQKVLAVAEKAQVPPQVQQLVQNLQHAEQLADVVAAVMEAPLEWKREVLLTTDPKARVEKVLSQLAMFEEVLDAQKSIEERVSSGVKGMERKAILRRQLEAIQEELGEQDEDELGLVEKRLEALELPGPVRESVDRELRRAKRVPQGSAERTTSVDWLEWIADMPWSERSADELDLGRVEDKLDQTHYGLEEVKKQVLQHLAVRKLSGEGRADVLLLVGPPGVGKTSIVEAIAEATNRKMVRVALGGMRDEAELRGHRRTYVGARPGRLVEGLRRGQVQDPVVLFDEVDKLGRSLQGDPASALLEILDPEQNHAFVDHYLEVPFDLSKALFVATANDLSTISPPLRDRMEIVELEGYTKSEKVGIARRHVLPKLAKNAGVEPEDIELTDAAIEEAVDGWTREAGVRQLQRALGKVFRAVAVDKAKGDLDASRVVDEGELPQYLGRRRFRPEVHDAPGRPGIATGLAWTPVGGDVLYVEASDTPGQGQLRLTGQLGEVMKESAQAALTYVLSNAATLEVPPDVASKRDVHVHVPAGATPKDGPSAGVTMFTALASLLSGRPVAADLAMTGEVSLRGRVLPVGGIKSKMIAAHARGLKRVILPKANEPDLDDVPEEVKAALDVLLVENMSEVLEAALEKKAAPAEVA
jgi:ATP-dependent Lon protease